MTMDGDEDTLPTFAVTGMSPSKDQQQMAALGEPDLLCRWTPPGKCTSKDEVICWSEVCGWIPSQTAQSVWDSTLIGRTINFSYQMLVWQRNQAWLAMQMEIDAAMTSPIHKPLRQYKEDSDSLWLSAHSILYHYKLDDPMLSDLQEQFLQLTTISKPCLQCQIPLQTVLMDTVESG
ncbi:hypothetical protein V8B97DRAFT_1919478 [Scleroderma yunnanense]